ncbi:hypothetical protein NIES4103_31510 [Nostoc sp. NIES-4103]|nr:hypothetical protein NIES4103_31510 [Nostoc sp. NIES-4103]
MRKTQKYTKACEILKYPHQTQDELYAELNRLGYYWDSKKKKWIRDNTIPDEATKVINVRVWAAVTKVEDAAALFIESAESMGFRFLEKSPPIPCRPPKQLESRVYLKFEEIDTE